MPTATSFVRIESISDVDGQRRVLDLQNAGMRELITAFTAAQATPLYEDPLAADYR